MTELLEKIPVWVWGIIVFGCFFWGIESAVRHAVRDELEDIKDKLDEISDKLPEKETYADVDEP